MDPTRKLAVGLLLSSAICLLFSAGLAACTYHSTGPFNPIFGRWAREGHFMQYRGGSSGMEPNGQFWVILTLLLGLGSLLAGALVYSKYKYDRDHPDDVDEY